MMLSNFYNSYLTINKQFMKLKKFLKNTVNKKTHGKINHIKFNLDLSSVNLNDI